MADQAISAVFGLPGQRWKVRLMFANRSYWIVLALTILTGGCGPSKITEFVSKDGKIRVTVFDPVDCDESRQAFAEVQGLDAVTDEIPTFSLNWATCKNSFHPDQYLWLEGADWCAIVSRRCINDSEREVNNCVFGIINRETGEIFTEMDDCPERIQVELTSEGSKHRGRRE
jgi:hypothetical protein